MFNNLHHRLNRWSGTVRNNLRAGQFRAGASKVSGPLKLHLACGQVRLNNWLNVDGLSTTKGHDVLWDLRFPLPLQDGSASFIFNEHFLEHLTPQDGMNFLKECHRLLQPGGVLRIAMPDLRQCVDDYLSGNWKSQPWLKQHKFDWIKTGAEYLNICMREWEHQWLYDIEELKRRLSDAGFQKTVPCQKSQSQYPELQNLETRLESLLIIEATKS